MAGEVEHGKLFIRDSDAFRVKVSVTFSVDGKSCFCRGVSDELDDGLITAQRFAAPVDGDEGKEFVLDFAVLCSTLHQLNLVSNLSRTYPVLSLNRREPWVSRM